MTRSSWLRVYTRAVVEPAWRRVAAVWLGCALVIAVAFGGNGLYPRDVATLAFAKPGIGVALAIVWILVFLPIARALVRAEPARYLRSLPHGAIGPIVVVALALVGLQLPWLALWTLGAGGVGLGVFALTTFLLVGAALVRARPPRRRWPGWTSRLRALAAMHQRALVRRASDTLLRAAGLAVLAGGLAALFVRNNGADGVLGASVATIALIPARIGTLAVLGDTHRRASWLAASLGVGAARLGAIVVVDLVVHAATGLVAIAAAALVVDPATLPLWIALQLAIAAGAALVEARLVARGEHAKDGTLVVLGSLAAAALAATTLGLFGPVGVLAFVASAALYAARQ